MRSLANQSKGGVRRNQLEQRVLDAALRSSDVRLNDIGELTRLDQQASRLPVPANGLVHSPTHTLLELLQANPLRQEVFRRSAVAYDVGGHCHRRDTRLGTRLAEAPFVFGHGHAREQSARDWLAELVMPGRHDLDDPLASLDAQDDRVVTLLRLRALADR